MLILFIVLVTNTHFKKILTGIQKTKFHGLIGIFTKEKVTIKKVLLRFTRDDLYLHHLLIALIYNHGRSTLIFNVIFIFDMYVLFKLYNTVYSSIIIQNAIMFFVNKQYI